MAVAGQDGRHSSQRRRSRVTRAGQSDLRRISRPMSAWVMLERLTASTRRVEGAVHGAPRGLSTPPIGQWQFIVATKTSTTPRRRRRRPVRMGVDTPRGV